MLWSMYDEEGELVSFWDIGMVIFRVLCLGLGIVFCEK